jgi:chromosomal replication initiator protein
MALARVLTGTSFPSLGKQFGNKDHSTVMNACNKVKKKINVEHDPKYTEDWENLNLQLTE